MIRTAGSYTLILLLCATALGCAPTVRTTQHSAAILDTNTLPEGLLLDVGIAPFDPGTSRGSTEKNVFPAVREAEARFMPTVMAETLQNSGNWGAVRVVPNRQSEMDVWVDGRILKSDGETLELEIKVEDAIGRVWFTKRYKELASKYAYDKKLREGIDPFQGIYNQVANDMLAYRKQMDAVALKRLRTITELKFAERFAPEVFGGYLSQDNKGRYHIERLPAESDPTMERIRRIRERDYMFVDTLQDYYGAFARQMEEPYRQWRQESFFETQSLRELKAKATAQTIGGALAVIGGILAQGSSSAITRSAGTVGILGGAYMVKGGLDKHSEANIHRDALKELSYSLHAELEPHSIRLEDRTVTLSGTAEQQYQQWRAILREIYITETGLTPGAQQDYSD